MNDVEMFSSYPDVVNFNDMREMLGGKDKPLGRTTAYKLLKENKIKNTRKIGREYRIPKNSIINYLLND